MIDAGDDGRLVKPATRTIEAMAARTNLRATFDRIAHVILDDL
jgi:hypothetical protein